MNAIVASFGPFGTPEMIIFAILVLVLFGAKKLPTFARSLGRSMGEFRRAKEEFEQELWRSRDDRAPDSIPLRPRGKTSQGNLNALVYLMMLISAILLTIGLGRCLGW